MSNFYIKSSTVPKGSKPGVGGSSTVVNNYYTNNYYVETKGDDSDNFKGKITISELNAIPESEIGENDLWLVYAGYSAETGWSEDSFYMNPSRVFCNTEVGSTDVLERQSLAGDTIRFVVDAETSTHIVIRPCDASGNPLSGQPAWVDTTTQHLDTEITVAGGSSYYSISSSSSLFTLKQYDQVPPATFAVFGFVVYTDSMNKFVPFKTWLPLDRQPKLQATSLYDPLQSTNDLITSLYPATSYPKNLYGNEIAGIKLCDISCYTLGDDSVYHLETFKQDGAYAGSTQTKTLVVPFARYYEEGGETVYLPGALTAADYQRLIEGGGGHDVPIDTTWPSNPSDAHVPSTKLVKVSLAGKSNTDHTHSDYATKTELNSHTTDAVVHVTATEKAKWNEPLPIDTIWPDEPSEERIPSTSLLAYTLELVSVALAGKSDVDHTHSEYETSAHAEATYETSAHAATTYETAAHAAATYETAAHASATYETIENVEAHTSNENIHVTLEEKARWDETTPIDTAWPATPLDTNVPSTKLVKTTLAVKPAFVRFTQSGGYAAYTFTQIGARNASLDPRTSSSGGTGDTHIIVKIAGLETVDEYNDYLWRHNVTIAFCSQTASGYVKQTDAMKSIEVINNAGDVYYMALLSAGTTTDPGTNPNMFTVTFEPID